MMNSAGSRLSRPLLPIRAPAARMPRWRCWYDRTREKEEAPDPSQVSKGLREPE